MTTARHSSTSRRIHSSKICLPKKVLYQAFMSYSYTNITLTEIMDRPRPEGTRHTEEDGNRLYCIQMQEKKPDSEIMVSKLVKKTYYCNELELHWAPYIYDLAPD